MFVKWSKREELHKVIVIKRINRKTRSVKWGHPSKGQQCQCQRSQYRCQPPPPPLKHTPRLVNRACVAVAGWLLCASLLYSIFSAWLISPIASRASLICKGWQQQQPGTALTLLKFKTIIVTVFHTRTVNGGRCLSLIPKFRKAADNDKKSKKIDP